MEININNFFSPQNLEEFKLHEKQNLWFGGTDTFSKIYDKILKEENRLILIKDEESLELFIKSNSSLNGKIEITDEIHFPFYLDISKNILIHSSTINSYPVISKYELKQYEVKSFFQKSYFIRLILLNEIEKGDEYTPLYYIKIFRSQMSDYQSIPEGNQQKQIYQTLKDVFLNYPIEQMCTITKLFSNSLSWRYSEEYGGIRKGGSSNLIDFVNDENEVFQIQYLGEGQEP